MNGTLLSKCLGVFRYNFEHTGGPGMFIEVNTQPNCMVTLLAGLINGTIGLPPPA
jgi:hypothetical protein